MLAYLHVKNIALIKELEIDFDKGLNILTGETGAGKSIVLGSINYVLGAKLKKDFIRSGAKEAIVECVFDISKNHYDEQNIKGLFIKYGISEDENGIIVSRKTTLNGRSVFRINGEVVRLEVITALASLLIDIHSQHEHQSLLSSSRQLDLLDRFAGESMNDLLRKYYSKYKEYNILTSSINIDLMDDEKRRREIAFLKFEMNEIKEASLEINEDIILQTKFDKLSHSKTILQELSNLNNTLYNGADLSHIVSSSLGELKKLNQFDIDLNTIVESLLQLEDLLGTLNRDVVSYIENIEDFEEEVYFVEKRLDLINQLKLKYGDTIDEIYNYLEEKETEHEQLVDFEKTLIETKENIKQIKNELLNISNDIYQLRIEKANKLKNLIEESLSDLNLENSKFNIKITKENEFLSKGMNKVNFMISTNKGEELKPLKEVASGGELSRIMLAIKSILASVDGVDTLVFDEIDTGISGQTAQKVAVKMAELSTERQLICITHLPQITAMANQHYLIQKDIIKNKTITSMRLLKEQESIEEVARMLSGAVTSKAILDSAKEMKQFAKTISKN